MNRLESLKIHVEKARLERELSLTELSRLSGVSISHIHYIELGEKIPSIAVLCKLAKALDTPCHNLFSY